MTISIVMNLMFLFPLLVGATAAAGIRANRWQLRQSQTAQSTPGCPVSRLINPLIFISHGHLPVDNLCISIGIINRNGKYHR